MFGNGLNRLSGPQFSWESLLSNIFGEKTVDGVPMTILYELGLLSIPYFEDDGQLNALDGILKDRNGVRLQCMKSDTEQDLKIEVAKKMNSLKINDAFYSLLNMPVDHYISTNFDKAFLGDLEIKSSLIADQERIYSFFRHYSCSFNTRSFIYWPIHGCIDAPQSIMLSYEQYCKSIMGIDSYLIGRLKASQRKGIKSIEKRLIEGFQRIESWIDLFFVSDIHIIGFGMSFDELDIWKLLTYRKRLIWKDHCEINNRIYFYQIGEIGTKEKAIIEALKRLEVTIEFLPISIDNKDYPGSYYLQFNKMRDNISNS